MKWKTALFLGVFCSVLAPYPSEEHFPKLSIHYPVSGNYSVVRAGCSVAFTASGHGHGIEWRKNETVLTSGPESHQVTIINDTGDGEISFSFTQEQEGVFSCGKGKNRSAGIGLAASPPKNYDGLSVTVTYPRLSEPITLPCPIRPGALTDSYRVTWRKLSKKSTIEISNKSFTLLVKPNELSSTPSYQCVVHVQHRSDQPNTTFYNGPEIILMERPDTSTTSKSVSFSSSPSVTPPNGAHNMVFSGGIRTAITIAGGVLVLSFALITVLLITLRQRIINARIRLTNTRIGVSKHSTESCHILLISNDEERISEENNNHSGDSATEAYFHDTSPTSHLPDCVEPIATLSNCTSEGKSYVNKANDFSLEIPEGAIPEGESITIDIGVALYGPYQYPEGLRPVSPVFWVCVRDKTNFQSLKPVTVSIPHFLNTDSEDDIKSLGLTFLKADHEMNLQHMYEFQSADGDMHFEPYKDYGELKTTHFCSLCIACNISQEVIRKAKLCMYAAIPCTMATREPSYVYFFVTFHLQTCLETVKKQIMKIPELKEHILRKQCFQFPDDSGSDPGLEIIMPQSTPPEWTVGLQSCTEILMSDIDFFVGGDNFAVETLQLMEEEGMYPPRFHVVISCTSSARQSQTRIEFRGATRPNMVFDIPLNPVGAASPHDDKMLLSSSLTLLAFMNHVASQIPAKWQLFGICLEIPTSEMDTYKPDQDRFVQVFRSWERRGTPELSWRTVVNILESPLMNEKRLATRVREMARVDSLSATSSD